MKSKLTLACLVALSASAFAQADLTEAFLPMFKPLPAEVLSPDNELTDAKINLGRMLYFENRISKGQKLSCNSCASCNSSRTRSSLVQLGCCGRSGSEALWLSDRVGTCSGSDGPPGSDNNGLLLRQG